MAQEYKKYYGATKKSIRTEDFNISLTLYPPNSKIRKHSHEKPYLCLLTKGMYTEEAYDSTMITNGTVLYRSAHYEHSNQFSNQQGVCLNLEIENPDEFSSRNDVKLPLSTFKQRASTDIYKLLFSFRRDIPDDMLNLYCYESLITHFNSLPAKGKPEWVEQVKEWINDNPFAPISLDTLSDYLQLHPNYIIRKFKEVTGNTLSEYLTKTRLESSMRDLVRTDHKITKIALNSGFYDQSHFNRNFKKYLTITPTAFRKSIEG